MTPDLQKLSDLHRRYTGPVPKRLLEAALAGGEVYADLRHYAGAFRFARSYYRGAIRAYWSWQRSNATFAPGELRAAQDRTKRDLASARDRFHKAVKDFRWARERVREHEMQFEGASK